MHQEKKSISIILITDELLYDIGSYAFLEGNVAEEADGKPRPGIMDVTADPDNRNLVARTLALAHSEAVDLLFPYTKERIPSAGNGDMVSNRLAIPDSYEIPMQVPVTFSLTTVNHIKNLVHSYMVARVLEEWMALTNSPNSRSFELWSAKRLYLVSEIQRTTLSRTSPIRLRKRPF